MNSELAYGTVGWPDDGGTYYEISQSNADDGNILVRVTLFRGRDESATLDSTNAQGTPVLCTLASSFIQVPPRGTRVIVASPHPFSRNGGSVIIAALNPNPNLVGNIKAGETNVAASMGVGRLMLKANGAVALSTKDNNKTAGNDVFRQISPTEDRFFSPWGSVLQDATGWHLRTWHGAKVDVGGLGLPAPFSSLGLNSSFMVSADMINIDAALLSLGRDAGFTQAVVQALPLQAVMTLVAASLTAIGASLAALGNAGAAAAIAAAVASLATVSNPASAGGTATNTTIA